MRRKAFAAVTLLLAVLAPVGLGLIAPLADASSHREAPLIANDPAADGTDFYLFRSPDKQDSVTLLANYIPLQPRYGGPNFHHPADEVRYAVKIDNDGNAAADIIYQWRFWSERKASAVGGPVGDTYLYNDGPISALQDANLLYRQYYEVTRLDMDGQDDEDRARRTVVAKGQVMPAFVGKQSYCGGPADNNPRDPAPCDEATAKANYEAIARSAIASTSEGGQVFVGPRQESFYVDLGKVFDLARLGTLGFGQPTNDTFMFNVTTLGLQVPINKLLKPGANDPVIGAWTTSSRQTLQVIRQGNVRNYVGPFMQVSRLSSPLVNELVIGVKDKDKFNNSEPKDDVQNFGDYVVNPRIVKILNALYSLGLNETKRGDLVQAFVTGIPGVNRPKAISRGGEMLRLNTAVPITPADKRSDAGILGVLEGNLDAQGFPNGRRVTDDVVKAELSALTLKCSGVDEGFGPTLFNAAGQLACTGIVLDDGVGKDGLNFLAAFPYLPTPFSATAK